MKWEYLNRAVLAKGNPKDIVGSEEEARKLLNDNPRALFVRWTTEFDIKEASSWWYVLKDDIFDIKSLNSNRRYKINKGRKYFDIRIIDPVEYTEELYECFVAALSGYPEKYRPTVNFREFKNGIEGWRRFKKIYAAFSKEDGKLRGYMRIYEHDPKCCELSTLKSDPAYEKYQINAAIISFALEDMEEFFLSGGIFFDGERTIIHETSFQDYLEDYFNFRKAYAKLHIVYRPIIKIIVRLLYPIRHFFKNTEVQFFREVYAVLEMEEIVRKCK